MLIAMPAMLDERFARSLIYVCAHSPKAPWASSSTIRAEHQFLPICW